MKVRMVIVEAEGDGAEMLSTIRDAIGARVAPQPQRTPAPSGMLGQRGPITLYGPLIIVEPKKG